MCTSVSDWQSPPDLEERDTLSPDCLVSGYFCIRLYTRLWLVFKKRDTLIWFLLGLRECLKIIRNIVGKGLNQNVRLLQIHLWCGQSRDNLILYLICYIFKIRHKYFRSFNGLFFLRPSSVMLTVPTPWNLKRAGLEISGRIVSSYYWKTERKAFFFRWKKIYMYIFLNRFFKIFQDFFFQDLAGLESSGWIA